MQYAVNLQLQDMENRRGRQPESCSVYSQEPPIDGMLIFTSETHTQDTLLCLRHVTGCCNKAYRWHLKKKQTTEEPYFFPYGCYTGLGPSYIGNLWNTLFNKPNHKHLVGLCWNFGIFSPSVVWSSKTFEDIHWSKTTLSIFLIKAIDLLKTNGPLGSLSFSRHFK